jgi:hypothetical protein
LRTSMRPVPSPKPLLTFLKLRMLMPVTGSPRR